MKKQFIAKMIGEGSGNWFHYSGHNETYIPCVDVSRASRFNSIEEICFLAKSNRFKNISNNTVPFSEIEIYEVESTIKKVENKL